MMAKKLPEYDVYCTDVAMGSAMGAALLVNMTRISHVFQKRDYRLIKA